MKWLWWTKKKPSLNIKELTEEEKELIINEIMERMHDVFLMKVRMNAEEIFRQFEKKCEDFCGGYFDGEDTLDCSFSYYFVGNDMLQIIGRKWRNKSKGNKCSQM